MLRRLASAPSSLLTSALLAAARHIRPSPVTGCIDSCEGFVSQDIRINHNQVIGGQYGRAVYARRAIPYGIELINVPAFASYVGEEKVREQCLKVTEDIFRKMCTNHAHKDWIFHRIMTLMYGGHAFFFREKDCEEFATNIKLSDGNTGMAYLATGEFNVGELQKIPQIVWFNRWDVEFRGRKGICLFPEVSYFSHDCLPNVEIEIRYSTEKSRFILSARTCKPVEEGEQLYIDYMPGNNLPLSRLGSKMYERWGFECSCIRCRSRLFNAAGCIGLGVSVPVFFAMQWYIKRRSANLSRAL